MPYLAVKEVAALLGVSDKFVYKHQKEIPGRVKIGSLIRWDKEVLTEELNRQARRPVKDRAYHGRHGL